MPTGGLFQDMVDRPATGLGDPAALRLALELHMLNLGNTVSVPEPIIPDNTPADLSSAFVNPLVTVANLEDNRSKKSQNMTECVPVPSSEHVAEIVGRQGCKIKALRAKTNTYIKTPVRGEEPVFVVTGRKEDVAKAKREILSAAEHFSQIRASRKNNLAGLATGASAPPGPPAIVPGHVTIQVRVPYRVVGLVVGPKGATIKRIQHQTHTYIVTPSRDKEPVFEVTGLPESVETARKEIEAHIAVRTGNGTSVNGHDANGHDINGQDINVHDINGHDTSGQDINGHDTMTGIDENALFRSLYKSGFTSIMQYVSHANNIESNTETYGGLMTTSMSSTEAFSSSASCSSSSSSTGRDLGNIWGSTECDEGLGDSPNFETSTGLSNIWSYPSVTAPTRPTPPASASPTELLEVTNCLVCSEAKKSHAMIPCGHNFFCKDCAKQVASGPNAQCPYCKMAVIGVFRIISSTNL